MLLSEGVCWCDCVMIMKLGPQTPVWVTEWSPEGFCHHPHSSQWWWFPFFISPPCSLSISPFVSLSPLPDFAFAFVPFQLFINTWWMLLCKKVSLKSFSLSHEYVLRLPSPPLFFWLHASNVVSNAGNLSDTHSLLSVTSTDVTQPWTPASSFTSEQPETFG